jgi:hypothetical protein
MLKCSSPVSHTTSSTSSQFRIDLSSDSYRKSGKNTLTDYENARINPRIAVDRVSPLA